MHIAKTSLLLRQPVGAPAQTGARGRGRARALVATAAACGAYSLWQQQQHRPPSLGAVRQRDGARRKPRVSWLAVDALSGAIGEIASLVVLYPLDSLKVLCQARGTSAAVVVGELRALGCSARAARQLYAGCGTAAVCSAAIGAIYLLAFYSAKRLGAAAMAARQQQQSVAGWQQPGGARGAAVAAARPGDNSAAVQPPLSPLVATLAGVAASLAGSVFEAPMEMFKLRTQAGALQGPMLAAMLAEASSRGLGGLYATYAAFMLKSIPYDVAELATYSQMCDWRAAAAARAASQQQQQQQQESGSAGVPSHQAPAGWQERVGGALAAMPASTGDMLIGAAAGVASVLVSMPCDVIKTRMDLSPPACPGGPSGLACSARAFVQTGRQLAAAGGLQALFTGVAPRLLQNVPSCMVYWAAVEGTRRFMLRHFDVAGPAEGGEAGGAVEAAVAAASSGSSSSSSSSSSSLGDAGGSSSSSLGDAGGSSSASLGGGSFCLPTRVAPAAPKLAPLARPAVLPMPVPVPALV